jgi:hypothetical protein
MRQFDLLRRKAVMLVPGIGNKAKRVPTANAAETRFEVFQKACAAFARFTRANAILRTCATAKVVS